MTDPRDEILRLNERLLAAIAEADWDAYRQFCDPSLTAFEPEARGHLVEGLEFHHWYFNLGKSTGSVLNTIAAPHVRILGDVALVCFVRLVQRLDASGNPATSAINETRVWHKRDGRWVHVHFHRSPA